MGIAHIATVITVALSGLLPSSCSKAHSSAAKSSATNSVAATASWTRNLGELSLTNHYETCVQLGAGKSFTITPKVLDHGNVRLTVAFESKKTDGHTDGLSVTEVVAHPGKSFELAVGDIHYSLTPNIVSQ